MTVSITVDGVAFDVPSSASDTNWAAKQVAFEQALAVAVNAAGTGAAIPDASGAVRGLVSTGTQTFGGTKTLAALNVTGLSALHETYMVRMRPSGALDVTAEATPYTLPTDTTCGRCRIPTGQTSMTLTCVDQSGAGLYPWAIMAWPQSLDATAISFRSYKSGTNDYVIEVNAATTANMDFGFLLLWP